MKLITSITIKKADHTQVIDTAAAKVGLLANKVFLFIVDKEIQGWKNLMFLCSWWLSKVGQKHAPIFEEVKGSAIALYRKGCQQETAFFQELIKTQITAKVDAHWDLHDQALKWFKAKVDEFLAEKPSKDAANEVEPEQPIAVTQKLEAASPVTKPDQPIREDDSPIQVLDPPVDDSLEDELAIPEDPAPVPASAGGKRGSRKRTVADLIKEEVGKA